MKPVHNEIDPRLRISRQGIALSPSNDGLDDGGVLNPASARTREGKFLLFPRVVQKGNISRIGIYESQDNGEFTRLKMALEPEAEYELRDEDDGYGCEDARVTFIPVLDLYVMGYTAFGPEGPRIAIAVSDDALEWTRLGLVDFSKTDFVGCHDKDVAFFPEPVFSPAGVESLAFYHRPSYNGHGRLHEDLRIAYISLDGVLRDRQNLLNVVSSEIVLRAGGRWGYVKVGAGTPPIRTPYGWLSLYHGVDRQAGKEYSEVKLVYRAGVMIHDIRSPHLVRYISPKPILEPEREAERSGVVDNVVFPTAIDADYGQDDTAMVYYGMADAAIGRALLDFRPNESPR